MERNIIYDDENIIGYSDDIAEDIRTYCEPEDELQIDLANSLDELDHELVRCVYHPMGAYAIYRLNEEYWKGV